MSAALITEEIGSVLDTTRVLGKQWFQQFSCLGVIGVPGGWPGVPTTFASNVRLPVISSLAYMSASGKL